MHSDSIKPNPALDNWLQKSTQGHSTSILCGYEAQIQAAESDLISKSWCYY